MPNYSLVVNSKFNPRTLQEMLVPFEKYGAAYKEQEDALAQLAAGASVWGGLENSGDDQNTKVWKGMVDKDNDPIAAAQLAKYATDLEAQRDALATQGLDVNSRKKMLDLKARYENEVGSIKKAYDAREEMRKAQQSAYINSGGNVRYSKWASQDSLDNYLNGKRPEYLTFNLDNVLKESAAGAKAMSERYFQTTEGRAFGNQYLNLIETQGLTPEQAMQAMTAAAQNDPKEYPEFTKLVGDLKTKYNIGQFSKIDQAAFDAAVAQGLNTGITYKRDNRLVQNGEYLSAAERFNQKIQQERLDLERESLQRQQEEGNTISLPDGGIAVKNNGVWEVTNPDGTKEIANTQTLIARSSSSVRQKPEDFTYLDFQYDTSLNPFGHNRNISFFTNGTRLWGNNYFSEKDARKLTDTELRNLPQRNGKAYAQIIQALVPYNLTIDDVDIYKDYDFASRDAYRIVYKGDNIDGTTPTVSGNKSSGSTPAQSGGYNGGFQ